MYMELISHSPDKKSIDNIPVKNIYLDYDNPRITWEKFSNEEDLLLYMYENYALDELAMSMTQFWYFDAEPVVCIPKNLPDEFKHLSKQELSKSIDYESFLRHPDTQFIVIEWNRRISTLKILLNINWIKNNLKIRKEIFKVNLTNEIRNDLENIPIIVYSKREDVIPYLWVRHIWWNKSWDPYAQAIYIDNLIKQGYGFDQVTNLIADKASKIIKNFVALKLLDLADKEGLDVVTAKNSFSFLVLSIWQNPIKEYLWLPSSWSDINIEGDIIPQDKINNFKKYFTWIYWDKQKGIVPVISESRDITKKITKILSNKHATKFLEENNDISWAYDRSDWEKDMVITGLSAAVTRIWNLKDLVSLLLSKQMLDKSEIEDNIFYLRRHLKDLEHTLQEYE